MLSGGLSILGSIIGGFIARGKSKAIEENTRFSAIDLHGIRHGLVTGEFNIQSWNIYNAIQGVGETLSETLWPIRWGIITGIPTKLDQLQASNVQIQQSMLAELQGIRTNTSELQGIVGAIRASAASRERSPRKERVTIEEILEDAIRLNKGNLREVIAETVRSDG